MWFIPGISLASPDVSTNQLPVAHAGTSRYLGGYPVALDGSGSFDPDGSGPLAYHWSQLSGPALNLSSDTSPMPTVQAPGSLPTEIELAVFQLIVSDGASDSLPDTVQVWITPAPHPSTRLTLHTSPFDPNKPTMVYFGGGDCESGGGSMLNTPGWNSLANTISFSPFFPDPVPGQRYDRCADQLISFLSSVAPEYRQAIQTVGFSTGGMPAIEVGVRLNRVYVDPRFAVNRVTLLEGGCIWFYNYTELLKQFVENPVNGEPAWVENVMATGGANQWRPYALNIRVPGSHSSAVQRFFSPGGDPAFYTLGPYNYGQTGGLFISVGAQGAHYRLAAMENLPYFFYWTYSSTKDGGHLTYDVESSYPGSLPEPAVLVGPANSATVGIGAITLGCARSLYTRTYELLWAEQGQALQVVYASSDPIGISTGSLSPGKTYLWTIRVRDRFGTTWQDDPRSFSTLAGLTGDFDGDGDMDETDCVAARNAAGTRWGDVGFVLAADLDGNGQVTCPDLNEWLILYRSYVGDPGATDPCGLLSPEDDDGDGVPDLCDNCLTIPNAEQTDSDGDGMGDTCDNCPLVANRDQRDMDADGNGDVCDEDRDGDGAPNTSDNCPTVANSDQSDTDGDGVGNECDNCAAIANAAQADSDWDAVGDACEFCPYDLANDADADRVCGDVDNCPNIPNANQKDTDGDGLGDVCDPDADNDGIPNAQDNCPIVANADQMDSDGDGVGDVCDHCPHDPANDADGDGICGDLDNCPSTPNSNQKDTDGDGVGNVCDPDADSDGVPNGQDNCWQTQNPDQIDSDGDNVGDVCDACPNTVPGSPVDATTGCPFLVPGDFDRDGDVDQKDFGHLQVCMSGADVATTDPACTTARLDADADVDQNDVRIFTGCMSGADVPANPACAP